MDPEKLLQVAEKAALAAGNVAHERFGRPHKITMKGFRDLVTDADIAAQETITNIIRSNFPEHGFLTEEDDDTLPAEGSIIWIIDPIDGTTNFSRNLPAFCVSIAAIQNKTPSKEENVLAGVIYDPMRNEMFSTALGGENQLNGRPMHTSQIDEIKHAQIAYDWNRTEYLRQLTLKSITNLAQEVETLRSFGTAALALAWVAAGRIDGYFNYSLKAWDMAAANLMIRQAGGRMSTISGEALDFSTNVNKDCVASNGTLHAPLITFLSK